MTSSYPAIAARRMALDTDGSRLFTVAGTTRTELDGALLTVNDEASDDLGPTTDVGYYLLAFPELRDVDGLYLGVMQQDPADWVDVTVEGSVDTTTGLDGTWTEMFASNRVQQGAVTGWWGHTAAGDYRRYIRVIPPVEGLRALRVVMTPQTPGTSAWRLVAMHVFGEVSAHSTHTDRLRFWHPTDDVPLPAGYFDWGNVPFGSTADATFRIKNVSASTRADTITVSTDALTDATPSVAAQHLLSYAASAYAASVVVPSLAPGALSKLVTLRRVTPSTAQGGPWALRVHARATSWTAVPV